MARSNFLLGPLIVELLALVALGASTVRAGTLTGPILNDGTIAVVEDFQRMPASSASRPLARINALREVPDGTGRLFVNDLNGPFYVIDAGVMTLYMDFAAIFSDFKIAPGLSTGFVSFAFAPDFATSGRFYTVHREEIGSKPANLGPAIPTSIDQHSILIEWTASDPSANTFAGTMRELMRIEAPHNFHNIGEIAFNPLAQPSDPDYGLLYIGNGDYGSIEIADPDQLQRRDTPFGTLMRIDPLGGPFIRDGITFDYGIPASNPFANDPDPAVLGEIYAYGFRNAHRIAWDAGGTVPGPYVSDIGQGNVEEVNRLVAGGNYGWPVREGTFALNVDTDPETVFLLPVDDVTYGFSYPVAQYDHDDGSAIAGGFVYRGSETDPLTGKFIFGDIVNGRIFYADAQEMLDADDGDPITTAQLYELNLEHEGQSKTLLMIVAEELGLASTNRVDLRFAMDAQGQIYITTKQDGYIRKLKLGDSSTDTLSVDLSSTVNMISPGVQFPFTLQIINDTNANRMFGLSMGMRVPGATNPFVLVSPRPIMVPANEIITIMPAITLPVSAPLGTYAIGANIFEPGGSTIDFDVISFGVE